MTKIFLTQLAIKWPFSFPPHPMYASALPKKRYSIYLPQRDGRLRWLSVGYTPRWFTCWRPQTVTHSSSNQPDSNTARSRTHDDPGQMVHVPGESKLLNKQRGCLAGPHSRPTVDNDRRSVGCRLGETVLGPKLASRQTHCRLHISHWYHSTQQTSIDPESSIPSGSPPKLNHWQFVPFPTYRQNFRKIRP